MSSTYPSASALSTLPAGGIGAAIVSFTLLSMFQPTKAFFFFFQAEDGIRAGHVTGSSDVCSSDLSTRRWQPSPRRPEGEEDSMQLSRRHLLKLGGAALAGASAAPAVARAQTPKRGGTLAIRTWDPPHFNP